MLRERLVFCGHVKAGHAPHLRLPQRCHNRPQIIGFHAHVAVVDDQDLVPRFAHHAHQLGYFVVDGPASRAKQNPNLPVRKIASQLLEHWNGGIALVTHAENQLIFGIVLPTVTRQIFVSFRVQPAKRFQITDGRRETGIRGETALGVPEKTPGAEQNKEVIKKRGGCNDEKEITGSLRTHCTPCAPKFQRSVVLAERLIAKKKE